MKSYIHIRFHRDSLRFSIDLTALNDDGLTGQLHIASSAFDCGELDLQKSHYSCVTQPNSTPEEPLFSNEPSDPKSSTGSSGGLSSAAKTGLGVGMGVGLPLLAFIASLVWRRYPRRNTRRSPRKVGAEVYSKEPSTSDAVSPNRCGKITSEQHIEESVRPVSSLISHRASASADRGRISNDSSPYRDHYVELEEQQGERFEMEEQQGARHEMDARSLPDIDDDDDANETRSLQDIEESRARGPNPPVGR